jgi:hypothetical protein
LWGRALARAAGAGLADEGDRRHDRTERDDAACMKSRSIHEGASDKAVPQRYGPENLLHSAMKVGRVQNV